MRVMMRYPGGRAKALTYSYDDGVDQDIRLIEILNKYNMKGTFNINSGMIAPEGTTYPDDQIFGRRMSESVCKEIYKGHEVAVHALNHPYLESIPVSDCVYEVYQDRVNLEKLTGGGAYKSRKTLLQKVGTAVVRILADKRGHDFKNVKTGH